MQKKRIKLTGVLKNSVFKRAIKATIQKEYQTYTHVQYNMPQRPPRREFTILKQLQGVTSLNKAVYTKLGLEKKVHPPMDVYKKLRDKHGLNAASMLKTRQELGITMRAYARRTMGRNPRAARRRSTTPA